MRIFREKKYADKTFRRKRKFCPALTAHVFYDWSTSRCMKNPSSNNMIMVLSNFNG